MRGFVQKVGRLILSEINNTSVNTSHIEAETDRDFRDTTPSRLAGCVLRALGFEPRTYGLKVRCSTD